MLNKSETITINKLKKLGFYFPEEVQKRFDNLRSEKERFTMLYNLFDKDNCGEREVIEFSFETPVLTDDEDCTKIYSHIEMNAFGREGHCWTICSVYEPKTMEVVKAVINLWNSSSTNKKKII